MNTNEARKQYLGQTVKAFGKTGIVTKVCAHNLGPVCLVKLDNGQTMVPFADEIEGIVIGYALPLEELLKHTA